MEIEQPADNDSIYLYSCNKCHKNPIIGTRWHCDTCEDYDLCEDCYNQKEYDEWHTAAHRMTCITPDDAYLISTLVPSGVDPEDSEQLLALAMKMSMEVQPSTPPEEVNASDAAMREKLLSLLLEDIASLRNKDGINTIPYLQAIYVLAQQNLTGDLNVEKERAKQVANAIFGEIKRSDANVGVHNTSLELDILLFKLLASILEPATESKDKHMIATSTSPRKVKSKKLNDTLAPTSPQASKFVSEEIANNLLSLGAVEYLFNTTTNLLAQFKKQPKSNEKDDSPSGALLKPLLEVATSDLFPFFENKEASNLFDDTSSQLLTSVFQIAQSLQKFAEKTSEGVFQEKWLSVICEFIHLKQTSFIRKSAKKLLLAICKSKQKSYQVRDACLLDSLYKKIRKLSSISNDFTEELPYDKNVKLISCLASIWEVASNRPYNWQLQCIKNEELLPLLFKASSFLSEETVLIAMKLLGHAFIPLDELWKSESGKDDKKKKDEKIDKEKQEKEKAELLEAASKITEEMKKRVELFTRYDDLSWFITLFLLESNTSAVRAEARNFIHWLWNLGSPEQQTAIFDALWSKIERIPSYGRNAAEFVDLFGFLVSQPSFIAEQDVAAVISSLVKTLKSQNQLLANHPNSYIYKMLSNYLEFDGYYLESEPCLVCNDPEVPYNNMKLDLLKAETKYTDSCQIVKFYCSHTIASISIQINDIKKAKMVRTINLYYNNKAVSDVAELRNKWSLWKKAKSCHLSPHQSELKVHFPIPITATNFMVEYAAFYENHQAMAAEKLQCPRCNRLVTDKHGICKHCRENAYQCRQCRNINFDNLNAYLCNECGYCKYSSFSYVFYAKPSYATDRMESDEDKKKGLATIDAELANAHKRYLQMLTYKKPLNKLIVSEQEESTEVVASTHNKINRKISSLATLYAKECKTAFDSLSKSVQVLLGTRRELIRYTARKRKGSTLLKQSTSVIDTKMRPPNKCFGCANAFIGQCLTLLEQLSLQENIRAILVQQGALSELFSFNLHQGTASLRADVRKVIGLLIKDNLSATAQLNKLIMDKINWALEHYNSIDLASTVQNEIQLLTESCLATDSGWESRLKIVFELFFRALELESSPVIAENIILPCLQTITKICTLPQPKQKQAPAKEDKKRLDTKPATPLGKVLAKVAERSANKTTVQPESQKVAKVNYQPLGDAPTISMADWEKTKFEDWNKKYRKFIIVDEPSDSSDKRATYLATKYFKKWKANISGYRTKPLGPFKQDSWIKKLLLCKSSLSIRTEIVTLIGALSQTSDSRTYRFLDLIASMLKEVGGLGECASELFELFKKLTQAPERKLYLTAKGFLPYLCEIITAEIYRIKALESTNVADISQGSVLKTLVDFLSDFLQVPSIRQRFKSLRLMDPILDGFLWLRGLIVQKTKQTDDSAQALMKILEGLNSDKEEDKQQFMAACVSALDKHVDGKTPLYIFEQLSNIICPTKVEPTYLLVLTKASTQEDYIRGSMTKNPYSSADIGPKMRDVKNKICRDLELAGFLDDDNGMELLVHNKIIKLDLTIKQVYEQVWKANNESQTDRPMVVVYRLQGLDGDATEEIVENLDDDDKEERDPEEVYKITSVMAECGGLEAMTRFLSNITDFDIEAELATLVLKLLFYCCKIKVNRRKMVEIGAINVLLEKLKMAFPKESQANIAEQLLLIIESIVEEANILGGHHEESDAMETDQELQHGMAQMKMFLEKLTSPLVRSNSRIAKTMTRVIPYLTYGHDKITELLIDYFLPYLNFNQYDAKLHEDPLHTLHLDCLVNVLQSIKLNDNGIALKSMIMKKGVTKLLVDYLKEHAPTEINSEKWNKILANPATPFVLLMLAGLSRGHELTQHFLFECGIIPSVHLLEDPSAKKIGILAQDLLDTITLDEGGRNQVTEVREATKRAKQEQARLHREQILAQVGLKKTDTGKLTAGVLPASIVELEEESGFTCKVCREGYAFKPDEILGIYTFSKKMNLPRSEVGISTVTHFTTVHFSCHQKCTKADRSLRVPKEEWEGATLRNSSTKCNNLFPIQGPSISDDNYLANVNKFWTNMNNIVRCDASKFKLIAHDLKFLMLRFAKEESFSTDSKGGGRDSNVKFIPFLVQMGLFFLDKDNGSQRKIYEKSLTVFASQDADVWVATSQQSDNILFHLITSFYLHSVEEWNEIRFLFLKRLLVYAFAESNNTEDSDFKIARPYLIYFALIDKLVSILKEKSGVPATLQSAINVSHKSEENWIVQMKKAIREGGDNKMMEAMKEYLQTYEEQYLVFEESFEFLDELGLLRSVMNEAGDANEWVKKIRTSVKGGGSSSSGSGSSSSSSSSSS